MVKTMGYCRVSTAAQADKGGSIATQRQQIAGYAQMKGLYAPIFFADEGVSGVIEAARRPAAAELLAALQPGDSLIVTKVDRLFRNARDALNVVHELTEKGVHCHIIEVGGLVSGNEPMPKLFLSVLSIFAEMEHARIKERMEEGRGRAREEGRYMGGTPPYGWRPDAEGKLEIDPDQQVVLAEFTRMYRDGKLVGMSTRKIASHLTYLHGVPISRNKVLDLLEKTRQEFKAAPRATMRRKTAETLKEIGEAELPAVARPVFKQRAKRRASKGRR